MDPHDETNTEVAKAPRGLAVAVLWHMVSLNVVVAAVFGVLAGSLTSNPSIGVSVAVGWLLLSIALPVAVLHRRKGARAGRSLFDPPRRLSRAGVRWRAAAVYQHGLEPGVFGNLSVSQDIIQFKPARGQGGVFVPALGWRSPIDQVVSIDVVTPRSLHIAPLKQHIQITTIYGKKELFSFPLTSASAASNSLNALLGVPRMEADDGVDS